MDKREETTGVLAGLAIGLFLALAGVIGATAGLGYLLVVLVLAVLGAGLLGGVAGALWQRGEKRTPRAQLASLASLPTLPVEDAPVPAIAGPLPSWLGQVKIFQGLTRYDLELIAEAGERWMLKDGVRLAAQGDRGDYLYVILSGQLRLTAWGPRGETTVRLAGPMEAVPVAALLETPILVTSVQVVRGAEVLAIPRERLLELCHQKPVLAMHLYRAVATVLLERYRATLSELTGSMRATVDLVAV
ncbi:MAG: cyclic nucleotide-binding domain-containing protein [Chloroflexi bacterium]|nr:cyclic nucleotide-binding domain-containing protein [Chloroflexota bacterium]